MPDRRRSEVERLLELYRAALKARNQVELSRLAGLWAGIERSLTGDMEALAVEIAEARAAGLPITEQLLWRMERYRILRDDLKTQVLRLARGDAPLYISQAQNAVSRLGLGYAQDMIKTVGGNAIFRRLPVSTLATYSGLLNNGTPLYNLLAEAYPYALDGIVKELLSGAARGTPPVQLARAMSDRMGVGLVRMTRIARTETIRAFKEASLEQYRESGVVEGWVRMANKSTACLACLALDGTELENEDDLEDHPNGGCIPVPKVRGAAPLEFEKGMDWLERQSEDRQREVMGDARYELWKEGAPIQDMVEMIPNEEWGGSPALTPIGELE